MLGRRLVVVLKVEPAALSEVPFLLLIRIALWVNSFVGQKADCRKNVIESFLVIRYELVFRQVNLSTEVISSKVRMHAFLMDGVPTKLRDYVLDDSDPISVVLTKLLALERSTFCCHRPPLSPTIFR